jgi:hypothetical protein
LRQLHFSSALLPDGWAIDVSITLAGGQIVRVDRGVAAASDAEHIAGAAVAGVGMPTATRSGVPWPGWPSAVVLTTIVSGLGAR